MLLTMSDKGGFQSSLFAGMNLGPSKVGSKRPSMASTSLSENNETKEQLNESNSVSKESVHTRANVISSTTHGSSFSFITDSQTAVEKDTNGKSSKVKTSPENTASVLDLFDTLDGGGTNNTDEQLSLSYSDQLAEILPSTTPSGGTLLTDLAGGVSDSSSDEDVPEYVISSAITVSGSTVSQDENVDLKVTSAFRENNTSALDDNDKSESNSDRPEDPESNEDRLEDTSIVSDVPDSMYCLELDPEESLTLFYSQHSFKLNKLREEREELQNNICALYEDVKNKMVSLEDQLSDLKTNFDKALNNDDYDLASEINEKIEELNTEKFELRNSRPKLLNEKIQEYLTCVIALREREREFHEWALTKYHDLQKEQNDLLEKHRQQRSNEINDNKQDLEQEKHKINRSLQHLQLDKEHLKKDKTDLDDRINSKLEVFQNRKKGLVEKQIELGHEIELLERRLKELRNEKTRVECSIKDEDDKMAEVRKEFESQEMKLKEKCDEIEGEEETLNGKLEEIFAKEEKLDQIAAEEQHKEESLVKNICSLTSNKEESETFIEKAQKNPDQNISDIFLTNLSQDNGDTLMRLKSSEKAKAKDLQDLELQVFNNGQGISTKTKRLDEIQNQHPELEKAKKAAVTDHNFKEAKRVNEILKQFSNEIETTRKELEQMKYTLTEDEEKTGVLKQEHATLKNDIAQAQEKYDLAAVVRIVNKMKTIVDLDTSADQDNLLETIKNEEISLLQTEFNYLEAPSESLLSKLSESDLERLTSVKEFLTQGARDIT